MPAGAGRSLDATVRDELEHTVTAALGDQPLERAQAPSLSGGTPVTATDHPVERQADSVARAVSGPSGRPARRTRAVNFRNVRVFTGERAAAAAAALGARAFTVGSDIVFGRDQYAPGSPAGRALLAHELTHVVQQADGVGAAPIMRQALTADDLPAADVSSAVDSGAESSVQAASASYLVDGGPAAGQMTKDAFLTTLQSAVTSTASALLAPAGWTADNCPDLARWFDYYRSKDAAHIERAIRRYAPETAGASSASDYIPVICARVAGAVRRWVVTGEVSGVPGEVAAASAAPAADEEAVGEGPEESSAPPWVQRAAREGGGVPQAGAARLVGKLGSGAPLEGSVASRFGSALGSDFSGVRVHRGPEAAEAASALGARAFTYGRHVGFATGEYRPGTLVGDAILAHELAHVAQQRDAARESGRPEVRHDDGAPDAVVLEAAADRSALSALASLWGNGVEWARAVAGNAVTTLRSGLQLRRCSTTHCPSGYHWAVTSATATGISAAACHWACVQTTSSGPALVDPNRPRPLYLPSANTVGVATQTVGGQTTCHCQPPTDSEGRDLASQQSVPCAMVGGGSRLGARGGGSRAGASGGRTGPGGRTGGTPPPPPPSPGVRGMGGQRRPPPSPPPSPPAAGPGPGGRRPPPSPPPSPPAGGAGPGGRTGAALRTLQSMRSPRWTRYRGTRDPIDPQLLELAKAERATQAGVSNEALSSLNVAVARVRVGDRPPQYLSAGNLRSGPHAEDWIRSQMHELGRGGQRVTLEQLYSERIPCAQNCGPTLTRDHPNAQIYFTTTRHGAAAAADLRREYGLSE